MPTPTTSFLDIAARYGDIDASDTAAVQRWVHRGAAHLAIGDDWRDPR